MYSSKRCKILVVDKKLKYEYLFSGFRKNKFSISVCDSVLKHSDESILDPTIFFVVIYESRDVIQLIKLFDVSKTVIIASESKKILNSFKKISRFPVIDLSSKVSFSIGLHDSITEILG
jgi:hypothetical protein